MLCQQDALRYEGEENGSTWASSFQSWRVLPTFRSLRNAQAKIWVKTHSQGNGWNRGFTWAPDRGLCGKGKVRALRHPRLKLAGDHSTLSWHFKELPFQYQNKIDLIISFLPRLCEELWVLLGLVEDSQPRSSETELISEFQSLQRAYGGTHSTCPEGVILKFPRERA